MLLLFLGGGDSYHGCCCVQINQMYQIKSLTFPDVYVSETAPPNVHIFRTSAYEYYSDSPRWL